MSGSPIIQNGKVIGAVTHVFVNDPTSGYGVHIEWMLSEAGIDIYGKEKEADCRNFRQFLFLFLFTSQNTYGKMYKEDFSTNSRFLVCQISFLVEKRRKT